MKTLKETQQGKVLRLLKESGQAGVNSHDLTYIHGIKQGPTRVKELQEQGYIITSSAPLKNRSVIYVLDEIPQQLKKPVRYEFREGTAVPVYD